MAQPAENLKAKRRATGCRGCGGSGWIVAREMPFLDVERAFICDRCDAAQEIGITIMHGAARWGDHMTTSYMPCWLSIESDRAVTRARSEAPLRPKRKPGQDGRENSITANASSPAGEVPF